TNARNQARERAAELGATHIVWRGMAGGYTPNVIARAYRCPKSAVVPPSAVVSPPRTSVDPTPVKVGLAVGRGLRVVRVEKGSPGGQVGVLVGDGVIAIDSRRIQSIDQWRTLLSTRNAGDKVKVALDRGGSILTVELQLVARTLTSAVPPSA